MSERYLEYPLAHSRYTVRSGSCCDAKGPLSLSIRPHKKEQGMVQRKEVSSLHFGALGTTLLNLIP